MVLSLVSGVLRHVLVAISPVSMWAFVCYCFTCRPPVEMRKQQMLCKETRDIKASIKVVCSVVAHPTTESSAVGQSAETTDMTTDDKMSTTSGLAKTTSAMCNDNKNIGNNQSHLGSDKSHSKNNQGHFRVTDVK